MRAPSSCVFLALSLSIAACSADDSTLLVVPTPDAVRFEQEVYPVLLRDCGFPACHGDPSRFFRVFGPGRTRYRPDVSALFAPATAEEIELAYARARSMLASEEGVQHALLLRKLLHGGHKGLDAWGNNVYQHESDEGYSLLEAWAHSSEGAAP